jgi:hypothetical protein
VRGSQNKDHELLAQFFGGYFHQDWDLDSETPADVVALYMRDSTPEEVDHLEAAISRLIDGDFENSELEESLFRDYTCLYLPRGAGQTAREFLQNILSSLSAKPR